MRKIKKILLIDDDRVCTYLAQITLEEVGIAEEIVICEDGQQALDYLNSIKEPYVPELILLDLNMPIMDGYEFLEEYMKIEALKGKNIHVVIVSSSPPQRERKRIASLPISAYIEKPLTEDKMTEVLSHLATTYQF